MKSINSTKLMYRTIQSCRHSQENTDILLSTLNKTIEVVQQQGIFAVAVPDHWIDTLPLWIQADIALETDDDPAKLGVLSSQNQRLFDLISVGAQDLIHLWAIDSRVAVRAIGYALHVLPSLLRKPERFDVEDYERFCFRIAAAYWHELSPQLQQAFCALLDLDMAAVLALIKIDGFVIEWG